MKIALLGNGKTGQFVSKIHTNCEVFNSQRKLQRTDLENIDAIICFLSTDAFNEYLPLLAETTIPVIIGTTGLTFENSIKGTWVIGSNFSLTMCLIENALAQLGKIKDLSPSFEYTINEAHHSKKTDSPSGTALKFKKWLNTETIINSIREGDIIGDHSVLIESRYEKIQFEHHAKSRALFAEGAIWAAKTILETDKKGIINFNSLVKEYLG